MREDGKGRGGGECRQKDRQTDRQADRQEGRQTDRQTGKQIDRIRVENLGQSKNMMLLADSVNVMNESVEQREKDRSVEPV